MPLDPRKLRPIPANRPVHLIVGWKAGGIAGGTISLTEEAALGLRDRANDTLALLRDAQDRAFDYEGELEADQFFSASTELISADSRVYAFLRSNEARQPVNANDLPQRSLWFYAISIGAVQANAMIFFRKANPYLLLKAGSIFSLGGRGLTVHTQPIFKIDNVIDVVLFEEDVAIVKKSYFEQIFLDEQIVEGSMHALVDTVTGRLGLDDASTLHLSRFAAEHPQARRRLRAIRSRGVLQNATLADIIAEINRQGLRVEDYVRDGALFVHPGREFELLTLLNEDRYVGGISHLRYQVDRKTVTAG